MDIFPLIELALSKGASDLHLVTSSPPMLRINGALEPVENMEEIAADSVSVALSQITTPEQREYFSHHLELDFARTLPGSIASKSATLTQSTSELCVRVADLDAMLPGSVGLLVLPSVFCQKSYQIWTNWDYPRYVKI